MSQVFHTLIYNPLYNGIVILMNLLPWADLGVIVIVFTIIIKLILFPLVKKSVETQVALRALEPELSKIRVQYKNNREEQARKTMELYRANKINPFSGFLLILIQLPIIFGLYYIFVRSGLPVLNTDILYSFVPVPEEAGATFLGFIRLTENHHIILAFLVGAAQFLQGYLITPKTKPNKDDTSLGASFAQSMHIQVKYVMPVVITIVAYTLPAVVGLYWLTSTIFTIVQELIVKRRITPQSVVGVSGKEVSS